MKKIITEEKSKTKENITILNFAKCTKIIPITFLCKPFTDSPIQETIFTQVTAIKSNIHQWQVYLIDTSPLFSVTTKDLLNQNEFCVIPPSNIINSATCVINYQRKKRESVKKEFQLISEKNNFTKISHEQWIYNK